MLALSEPASEPKEGDEFSLRIVMAGAVRGKGAGRAAIVGGHAHVFTDSKTRNELADLRHSARINMAGKTPYLGAIVVHITAYRMPTASMPKKKLALALAGKLAPATRPDADNYMKLICDGLNKIVWGDDAQIVEAHIYKRYSEHPRLVLQVNSWVG